LQPLWGRRDGALAADVVVPGGLVGRAREDARLVGLLARVAAGDRDGLAEVYDLTCSRVYGAVLGMLGEPGVAGEVTREIYLQIWREAAGFDPARGGGLAWIMGVAHNRCVDRVRTVGMDAAADRAAGNDTALLHRLWGRAAEGRTETGAGAGGGSVVGRVLAGLPESQRQVLGLTYFAGYSQHEVAQLLELPLAEVQSQLGQALAGLREGLGVGT
jgi:RNA polymerase sigma-70 factor, ECF subfamily